MGDLLCSFLNFRSPSTTFYISPSNNFPTATSFSLSFRKHNRKPLLCKPVIDVISTHEHSDGSLVFRFGDPSEVVENVELEKPVSVDSGVGKDLDGDNEDEVAVEREENGSSLAEFSDESDLVDVEKPVIKIESGGVLESSAVGDLDDDRESEVMVDKVERELNGSSLAQDVDESDLVDLEKSVNVGEEVENEGVIESNAVEDLDSDRENDVMVDKTEREVTGSSLREVPNESYPVELEEPVILEEETESKGVIESSAVQDLDGDRENGVMINKVKEEVNGSSLTEVSDEFGVVELKKAVILKETKLEGVIESSAIEDLDNKAMVDKVKGEANGSSLTEVSDEFDPAELEKPVIIGEEIENKEVTETSAVEDLDGDRENEAMVDKVKGEANGSSFTDVSDEFGLVELEKPVILKEETKGESVTESSAVEDLDGDRENGVMVKEAEKGDNGSGLTELTDEFDPVELETPVTVDEGIESDGMGQSSVGKVLDGDHESVAKLNEAEERDLNVSSLTELSDDIKLVDIFKGDSELSGSEEELPVPMLNVAVEVSSTPEPHIQKIGYGQEVLIEDCSLQNVAIANEIPEIEITNVPEELSDKNIGNATTLQPDQSEPEPKSNNSQCSTGITVTVDDLSVSEHQGVDTELHNGSITSEDSTSYSEVAENSTDVSVDSVEAEPQNEVSKDSIEIDSSEILSNSSNLQVDVSLSKEAKCDTSQVSVQTVGVGNECESYANDIAVESSQLEADITDTEAQTSEMGYGTTNESVKDGSDVMQFTSVSPQLEAESQNEIGEDGREIGSSALLSNSPYPQVDTSLSEVVECQISEVPLQSEVTGNEKEIDAIDNVSSSTLSEADINLSTETDTRTSEKEIVESESGVIQFTPMSPQLEAESQRDEEISDGTVEEFKEDEVTGSDGDIIRLTPVPETGSDSLEALQNDEVESQPMTNGVPQDLVLETERINVEDNLQVSQLPVASGNEMVEPESIEYARKSEEIATDFVLSSGAAALPHPTKVLTGGEDAFFVTGKTWLGVADGVLQWSLDGTNSGVYAQDLIRTCEKLTSDSKGSSISYPLDLLNSSVAETLSSGCSTVLLARFDGQVLHVANVGDSGFIILRHGTVYKRSLPMLHAFHLPLQIQRDDDPSLLAELYSVDLEEDDVIVTATDGLFDNLYDQEISSLVFKSIAADIKLEEIAELLATKAQEVGGSTYSRSPFADSAQAAGYVGYTGGKLDDVTVIVSVVQRRSTSLSL